MQSNTLLLDVFQNPLPLILKYTLLYVSGSKQSHYLDLITLIIKDFIQVTVTIVIEVITIVMEVITITMYYLVIIVIKVVHQVFLLFSLLLSS